LPNGGADGEQIAGTYKSRFARFELSATVQSGTPVDYHLVVCSPSAARTLRKQSGDLKHWCLHPRLIGSQTL